MYVPESVVTCFIDSKPTESLFPQEPGLTGGPISPQHPWDALLLGPCPTFTSSCWEDSVSLESK